MAFRTRAPLPVPAEPPGDVSRSKLLMGVGGFVLGLVYLALGIFFFLCSKKGVCWGSGAVVGEGGWW